MSEARLAIVGGGVTKDRAPFDDPSVVIWSTASVGLGLKRCDAIFELHDGVFPAEGLNAKGVPIYMRESHDDIPNSRRLPINELIKRFGPHFNGTVVMMLAFAAIEGFKNIDLYGVDMSSEEEYSRRNQFYYMMGYLSAQGYKINICPGGYLNSECKTYMYESDDLDYLKDIKQRAANQIAEDEQTISGLEIRKAYMRGVNDTCAKFERRY